MQNPQPFDIGRGGAGQGENSNATECRNSYVDKVATAVSCTLPLHIRRAAASQRVFFACLSASAENKNADSLQNWTQQVDLVDTYTSCLDKVYGNNGSTRRLLSDADEASFRCDKSYKASAEWIDEVRLRAERLSVAQACLAIRRLHAASLSNAHWLMYKY